MEPISTVLLLQALFAILAFGWRTVMQVRATGSTGFVAHRERGAVAKAAGLALAVGLLAVVAGTALADDRDWGPLAALGVAAMLAGLALTLVAQRAMGASWRIGVDPEERTELVTNGLFGRIRNPIFTGMICFALGSALVVPTVVTVVGALVATAGIWAQVQLVEEPHLRRQHGTSYDAYLQGAGRFLPKVR